jgi:hypothetical protein
MKKPGCVHSQDMHDITAHLVLVIFLGESCGKRLSKSVILFTKTVSAYFENYTKPTNRYIL